MITDWELTSYVRALRDDPRFDPGFRQLVDLRRVEAFQLTLRGVREFATLNPFAASSRRAVIVDSNVGYGMVRMYQSCLTISENLLVCRDEREALEWIGLDPETAWVCGPVDWISACEGRAAPND